MEAIERPLLRLGRLELDAGLRALRPGPAASDLVVTATVEVPVSDSEPQYAWEVAWADAGREAEALVLGAGDQHILDAVAKHLPGPFGPITTIASGPVPEDGDERLRAQIATALDEITGEAVRAVGDLVASAATGPAPGAVRGIEAVAWQLAEQQVALVLVAADIRQDDGPDYRLGSSPTQFGAGDPGTGIPVPLEDGLVWAALHQDAIVVQLPDRSGPLASQPAAALLRRGAAS